jgi:hypothetical protein
MLAATLFAHELAALRAHGAAGLDEAGRSSLRGISVEGHDEAALVGPPLTVSCRVPGTGIDTAEGWNTSPPAAAAWVWPVVRVTVRPGGRVV